MKVRENNGEKKFENTGPRHENAYVAKYVMNIETSTNRYFAFNNVCAWRHSATGRRRTNNKSEARENKQEKGRMNKRESITKKMTAEYHDISVYDRLGMTDDRLTALQWLLFENWQVDYD